MSLNRRPRPPEGRMQALLIIVVDPSPNAGSGVAVIETDTNISGYLRGTWRDGDEINGWSISAGGRIDLSRLFGGN